MSTPGDGTKRPLPAGWRWVKLGEVCEERTGIRDPRQQPDSVFHYVDITSVDNKSKRIIEPKTLFEKDAPSRARQVIRAGDVLVATTRPNLNAVALVPAELDNQICSTGFCVLRAKTGLDPDFLFAWVQTPDFIQGLVDLVKGALYPAVTDNQVRAQDIPLPPLSEQQRIAAILREQMAAVERARRAAQEQLEAAKAMPAAFLRRVFPRAGQPLPAGWRWVKLGEVCKQDRTIVEPDSTLADELPYLSLEHIESNTGRILKNPTDKVEDEGKSTTFYFDDRHVLYGKLRPYLNKVALPDFAGRCTTEMIPLLPSDDVDREFLCWTLHRQETVDAAMKGKTGSRMPRADMDELLRLEIPLPPLSEQQRIAAILREQMAAVERARKAIEAQLEAINQLLAAILKKAFEGRL